MIGHISAYALRIDRANGSDLTALQFVGSRALYSSRRLLAVTGIDTYYLSIGPLCLLSKEIHTAVFEQYGRPMMNDVYHHTSHRDQQQSSSWILVGRRDYHVAYASLVALSGTSAT